MQFETTLRPNFCIHCGLRAIIQLAIYHSPCQNRPTLSGLPCRRRTTKAAAFVLLMAGAQLGLQHRCYLRIASNSSQVGSLVTNCGRRTGIAGSVLLDTASSHLACECSVSHSFSRVTESHGVRVTKLRFVLHPVLLLSTYQPVRDLRTRIYSSSLLLRYLPNR